MGKADSLGPVPHGWAESALNRSVSGRSAASAALTHSAQRAVEIHWKPELRPTEMGVRCSIGVTLFFQIKHLNKAMISFGVSQAPAPRCP